MSSSSGFNKTWQFVVVGGLATVFALISTYLFVDWQSIFRKFFGSNRLLKNDIGVVVNEPKVSFSKSIPSATTVESDDESDDDEDDEEDGEEPNQQGKSHDVAVDSGSDDEEEEEEDRKVDAEKEEAFLIIKGKYDDASRISAKLIQGQQYERAAEKLSECIALAADVNVANRDVTALYNNRSAMYEKCGEFDKALKDIKVLLAMDPNHAKARGRRGRIYEAQGKHALALKDFVYGMVVERMKQVAPTGEKKIEDLSKIVASDMSVEILKEIRTKQDRKIPHKAYNFLFCRNFMETFPNTHKWKSQYKDLTRDVLQTQLQYASDTTAEIVRSTLELVCFDLSKEEYVSAFETFSTLEQYFIPKENQDSTIPAHLLSLCWELKGTELHLKFFLSGALEAYTNAVTLNPNNVDAKLKLAGIHMELGENDKAAAIYQDLLTALAVPSDEWNASLIAAASDDARRPKSPPSSSHSRSNSETERGDGTPARGSSPVNFETANNNTTVDSTNTVVVEDVDSEDENFASAKTHITSKDGPSESIKMDGSAFLNTSSLLDSQQGEQEPATAEAPSMTSVYTASEIVVYRAWTLIHRANIWIARDDKLQYLTNCVNKALADVDAALKLTDKVMDIPEGKAARFVALLKSVHMLTQTKQLVGEQPTEEDNVRNKASIAEAKKLYPHHESRLLLEADLLSAEGKSDEALQLVEEAHRTTLKGDVTPLVMKASILCTKVLIELQSQEPPSSMEEHMEMQQKTQESFKGVESYYEEALQLEPDGIEVLAQYAQYKNMVSGDFEGAVTMLSKAVKLSRSRDEAIELCQLLVMNEAQWEAIRELQQTQ